MPPHPWEPNRVGPSTVPLLPPPPTMPPSQASTLQTLIICRLLKFSKLIFRKWEKTEKWKCSQPQFTHPLGSSSMSPSTPHFPNQPTSQPLWGMLGWTLTFTSSCWSHSTSYNCELDPNLWHFGMVQLFCISAPFGYSSASTGESLEGVLIK